MPNVYDIFLSKYKRYTAIQEIAIPIISKGNNCIVVAPTGSGKTEAAILPVIDNIVNYEDQSGIKVLYITPLRALNRDMIKRLEWICKESGITISVRHGDTTQSERRKQAKSAPCVLITTPETLQSILPTKTFSQYLKNVKFVIIDEIHELYSNKRGAQLSLAMERLASIADFKRIGLSATVADPETIGKFLCNNREFRIAILQANKQMDLKIEIPKGQHGNARSKELAERFGLDENAIARLNSVSESIEKSRSALIFANTRQVVEALGSRLLYINKMHDFGGIGVHHSSLDKDERIDIENRFKDGKLKSIIATSSLELGIDVGEIDLVVQYGSPRQALRLAQRVGRSGHSESGRANGIVIAIDEIDAIESISIYDNLKRGVMESFNVHENALDVLCQQICGIALERNRCTINDVLSLIGKSFVYRNIGREGLSSLLEFMSMQHLVGFDGNNITSGTKTRMYYYEHLSVIPDTKRLIVKSIADNKIISSLDERFVASNLEESTVFIVKGLPWKVVSIDDNVVSVEPSDDLEAAVPDWTGEDIPVSYDVAHNVMNVLKNIDISQRLKCLNKSDLQKINSFSKEQLNIGISDKDTVLIEKFDDYRIIHTPIGTLANEAFARLVAHVIAARLGRSVNIRVSPYFILVEIGSKVDIKSMLRSINTANIAVLFEDSIKDTELFRYRFITVAKLFGVVEKDATVSKSLAKRIMNVMKGTPVYSETMRELTNNYFDIKRVIALLDGMHSGSIRITEVENDDLSPISRSILNMAYYTRELIMPLAPNRELVNSFSEFLLKKSVKLLSTYCGFAFTRKISEIRDLGSIKCPACGSPMIVRFRDDYDVVIKKRLGGKKLGAKEQKVFREMQKEESLFVSYGGKAAVALSTYGIGPTSAARALLMYRNEERMFFTDLIEAQKQFIRTKKYWSI